jgi:hypothetical protein
MDGTGTPVLALWPIQLGLTHLAAYTPRYLADVGALRAWRTAWTDREGATSLPPGAATAGSGRLIGILTAHWETSLML